MANSTRYNNVFVLCTGRCGSATFIQACKHIKNYTAGHETNMSDRWNVLRERFIYPVHHIEADNRLSFFLGSLSHFFARNETFYVHLIRDENSVVESFTKRYGRNSLADNFLCGILFQPRPGMENRRNLVRIMVRSINHNIEHFLARSRANCMGFPIEYAKDLFPTFCERIGAKVNMDRALAEFNKRYNHS